MSVKSLIAPFGHSAPYIATAVLIVVIILIVWAFRQGRTVEFWPPRIGALPRSGPAAHPDDLQSAEDAVPGPAPDPQAANVAKVFEVDDAAGFYQAIAPNYDQRNSVNLLATHMEVITRIDLARRVKPALRVLDLGGGTGQNVATYFFNDNQIRWTYVDSCPTMVDQLQKHLAGRPLYARLNVHVEDMNRIHLRVPAKSHDVVLINLVLSSMPELPNFNRIAGLLAPDGMLIISDINPLYTSAHPYYTATAADRTLVALRTHAVQPLEVVTRATEAGLQLSEITQVGSDAISYSFIVTFASAARPDADHRGLSRNGVFRPDHAGLDGLAGDAP